jgi:hypothetical protein
MMLRKLRSLTNCLFGNMSLGKMTFSFNSEMCLWETWHPAACNLEKNLIAMSVHNAFVQVHNKMSVGGLNSATCMPT